jgi:FixJ family two-component response regulator
MPEMAGTELAKLLAERRPRARVLYVSGYAQPVLAQQGRLDPGLVLLEKPFTGAQLIAKIREVMDQ